MEQSVTQAALISSRQSANEPLGLHALLRAALPLVGIAPTVVSTAMDRDSPLTYLRLSNLVTYAALACAIAALLTAATLTGAKAIHVCAILLVLAALADIFDGKFARLFTRTEKAQAFGAHLDSLTDAVVFGATPVGCFVLLLPRTTGAMLVGFGLAALFYLLCIVTRLAYYDLHAAASDNFVGVPTTVMNLVWGAVLFIHPAVPWLPQLVMASLVLTGGLMIAPIPIPRPRAKGLAVVAAAAVALLATHATLLCHG